MVKGDRSGKGHSGTHHRSQYEREVGRAGSGGKAPRRQRHAAGIKVVHVAFKGGSEAMVEAMTERTHYSMGTLTNALPFIWDGRLLALAVHIPQRSHVLPEVPALAETLPEFKRPDASKGLLAPAGTPRPLLNQISKEVARILDLPEMKERLEVLVIVPAPTTPEAHDTHLRAQIETLARVVRDAGLRTK